MKKNIVLFGVVVMLAGCANVVPSPPPKDQEPILVGLPMRHKVSVASKEINDQMELLNKVTQGKYVGTYKLVTHNNNLDAREGSSRTVPPQVKEKTKASPQVATNSPKIIKKIDWKNSSLNELVKGFGSAMDYSVVVVSKNKDKNITFSVENEEALSALNRLKSEVSGFALITLDDKNKTIYINYN